MCCALYNVTTNNSSISATSGTEDTITELTPPAGVQIYITRIKAGLSFTTTTDSIVSIRVIRASTAGATGAGVNIRKHRPESPFSVTTPLNKNGINPFSVGTVVDVMLDTTFNSRGSFEWIPRTSKDVIWSNPGERLAILMKSTIGQSAAVSAEVD